MSELEKAFELQQHLWADHYARFIERQAGLHPVPFSILRPLRVLGEHAQGDYRVPFATTERGLVAGVNRGCKVITASGGAVARVFRRGMTRAPGFRAQSVEDAVRTFRWVESKGTEMVMWPEARSEHVRLTNVNAELVGRYLYLRLKFECGDAMGGNSVTILSDRISRRFAAMHGIEYLTLSSNLCVDKKPGAVNVIAGRGFGVVAEVTVPEDVVRSMLRTAAERIEDLVLMKLHVGSGLAGAPFHHNCHAANVLAAVFVACGQDLAQIVESSSGFVLAQSQRGSLSVSLTLPCLEVGTVGGGTEFGPAHERLASLGCLPEPNRPGLGVAKFAELVAAVCLAGEISLLASLAEGSLANATSRLGRGT